MSIDIERNFNRSVRIDRLSADESGEGETYTTHIEAVPCMIQPADASYTEDLTGHFGKNWLLFCDSLDILEGDRVVDGSDIYQVVSAESFEFLGQTRHMECLIRKGV